MSIWIVYCATVSGQWIVSFLTILPTCQPQHTTTSCWFGWHGMDGISSSSGRHLYHRTSPGICWRRFEQLPELRMSAVQTRRRQDEHRVGTHQLGPSFFPNQRFGSLGLRGNEQSSFYVNLLITHALHVHVHITFKIGYHTLSIRGTVLQWSFVSDAYLLK